jgi:hypothetical protein
MVVLKDGSGQGYLAKVGAANDLHTRAIVIAEISNASENEGAFQAEGETTITAATEKTVLLLINSGTSNLEVGNIFLSLQNESGKISTMKIYIGKATYTSGGTAKSATNLNTGSNISSDTTLYEDNPTVGGTDHLILELYFQSGDGSSITSPFHGGIVLTPDGSFRATVTGGAGAAGTYTCDASFQFWEESDI